MIVSAYPRGYDVLGPRIPWLSRFRLLTDEPWDVEIIDTATGPATPDDATTFCVDPDDAVITCHFELRGATSHQPWALALASYPVDAFNDAARSLLLTTGFVDDDQLERVSGRRLVGYHERINARLPTPYESDRLEIPASAPVLTLSRTARTTTMPISQLAITARTDRLDVDYLIEP
jgi:DNA-binding GntR family transcriptional regulator